MAEIEIHQQNPHPRRNPIIFDIEANFDSENSTESNTPRISMEELVALYNEAFDRNKNQMVLEDSRILWGDIKTDKGAPSDTSDEEDDVDDDASVYQALERSRSFRRSERIGKALHARGSMTSSGNHVFDLQGIGSHESGSDEDEDSIVIASSNTNSSGRNSSRGSLRDKSSRLLHPRAQAKDKHRGKNVVRGICVVCLEEYLVGETVVWSETPSCRHVYHKDCMVSFLAHKASRGKQQDLGATPCPTCRQPFVTVCAPPTMCTPATGE